MSPQKAKKKTTSKKVVAKKASKKLQAVATSKNDVKPKLYASLVVQLLSLLKGEHDFIAVGIGSGLQRHRQLDGLARAAGRRNVERFGDRRRAVLPASQRRSIAPTVTQLPRD